jgi:hypothetical protein
MFVIVDLGTIYHTQYVDMFMICLITGPEEGYFDWDFMWLSSDPLGECWNKEIPSRHEAVKVKV